MLQRLVKQRRESADIYRSKGRTELAEAEDFQAAIIEKYLPTQMSNEEVEAIVKQIITETGASSMKDMGKVIAAAGKAVAGQADNKTIADMVKKCLTN
jgi:hypothetical protein